MNKNELIRAIAEKSGLTLKDAGAAFDGFVKAVTDALKAGDKIQISGFGSYEVKIAARAFRVRGIGQSG